MDTLSGESVTPHVRSRSPLNLHPTPIRYPSNDGNGKDAAPTPKSPLLGHSSGPSGRRVPRVRFSQIDFPLYTSIYKVGKKRLPFRLPTNFVIRPKNIMAALKATPDHRNRMGKCGSSEMARFSFSSSYRYGMGT